MTTAKTTTISAAKAEAKNDPQDVEFEFEGQTYTVAADAVDDLELYEALEDERFLAAIRGFIGEDQWERFKRSIRDKSGKVRMSAAEPFLNKLLEAMEEQRGN